MFKLHLKKEKKNMLLGVNSPGEYFNEPLYKFRQNFGQ